MNTQDNIIERLDKIEQLIVEQGILQKEVLSFNEASQYLGLSQSHLYKLTSTKAIPHFCPQGKRLYFNRKELDEWLQRNRQTSADDIEKRAADYLVTKGRRG
ncbi:helix-turn-helix domain-containing protein [Halocola ammonii]